MTDSIRKYFYEGDTKLTVVRLDEVCAKIAEMQNITRRTDCMMIRSVAAFTAALSSQLKEPDSYLTVKIRNIRKNIACSATAFGDGRVCGFTEKIPPEEISDSANSFILEAVRKSDMGGEYTSVVMGSSVQGAINAYITESMQRSARWKSVHDGSATVGIFAEDIPGTNKLRKAWGFAGKYLSSMDEAVFTDGHFSELEEKPLSFGCKCTKRSVKRVLMTLPEEERRSLGKTVEISCKFCGRKYVIDNE